MMATKFTDEHRYIKVDGKVVGEVVGVFERELTQEEIEYAYSLRGHDDILNIPLERMQVTCTVCGYKVPVAGKVPLRKRIRHAIRHWWAKRDKTRSGT